MFTARHIVQERNPPGSGLEGILFWKDITLRYPMLNTLKQRENIGTLPQGIQRLIHDGLWFHTLDDIADPMHTGIAEYADLWY